MYLLVTSYELNFKKITSYELRVATLDMSPPNAFRMGPTPAPVGITALKDARCQAIDVYRNTRTTLGERCSREAEPYECQVTIPRLIYPHPCFRKMVPNSPHMAYVDPGARVSLVNRSTMMTIKLGSRKNYSYTLVSL